MNKADATTKTRTAKDAEAPKNPETSSNSSSSSDSTSSSSSSSTAGELGSKLDEVALHLNGYGYAAANASQWQVPPASGTGPQVKIQVTEHTEVEGHVNYLMECLLEAPEREQVDWMVAKRLRDMTSGLLTPVKAELRDAYREHFKGAFVQKNSVRKTVERLNEWCLELSVLVNSGGCKPALVSSLLRFLDVPKAPASSTPEGGEAEDEKAEDEKDEAAGTGKACQGTSEAEAPQTACKLPINPPPEPPARGEPTEEPGKEESGLAPEQEALIGRCQQAWAKLLEDSLALEHDPEFLARVRPHFPTAPEMHQAVREAAREAEGPATEGNDAEEVD